MRSSPLRCTAAAQFQKDTGIRRPFAIVLQKSMWSLALGLTAFLAGCSGGSLQNSNNNNNQPLNPGTVTISAPASGATITGLPVTITLNLQNGAALSAMKVTLDGFDVTSAFASGANNTATAAMTNGVYVGNNRIQVTIGSQTVESQFSYDPSAPSPGPPTDPGAGSSMTPPDVVPIQTRVRMTTQINGQSQNVWGVQVGGTAYPDPNGNTDGFQVVILRRADLSLVTNTSFQLDSDSPNYVTNLATFVGTASPGSSQTSQCGIAGCLEIIQSLNTVGSLPCLSGNIYCSVLSNMFANIGATTTFTDDQGNVSVTDASNLGYSFIGNVGAINLHSGSNYERVTCASSDGCIAPIPPANAIYIKNPNPPPTYIANEPLLSGIAPDGVDGVMSNLANTGSSGTTNLSATNSMPAMTVSNNGAMTGELILDNTNNYTFAYPDPPIHFQMGVAPDSPTKNLLVLTLPAGSTFQFPNGETYQAIESAKLPKNPDGSPVGGFRLVVFDGVTFQNLLNSTYVINPFACPFPSATNYCIGPDGTPIYHLDQLAADIKTFNSRKNILFVASMGNLNHDIAVKDPSTGTQYNMQDVWDRVAQAIQDIGGTYVTFVSLNNPAFARDDYDQYTKNTVPQDDYALVGQWWINGVGINNPYAMEESSQIARQTEKYPVPSNVQGVLEKENDGYYRVSMHTKFAGLLPDIAFNFAAAALLPPVNWPLTGPNDSNDLKAAYAWISQQLLVCVNGCSDIRAAYTNLNQDPAIWLDLLESLQAPSDTPSNCSPATCPLGFDQNDFDTAKAQLLTEFQYLGVIREYQNNVLGLLQSEQANVSLILQQTTDEVISNIQYVTNDSTTYGISDWRTDVEDSLGVVGDLSGFLALTTVSPAVAPAIQTSIGITDFALEASAKHTNDNNGRSLIEQAHDFAVASQLAQKEADQYASTLVSLGADFTRVVSDWGRLQFVGKPIVNNGFVWSPEASGDLLESFDTSIRRSFYKSLLIGDGNPSSTNGYIIYHYTYASPGVHPPGTNYLPGSNGCFFYNGLPNLLSSNPDAYAYLPGALIDGTGATLGPNSLNTYNSLSTGNLYPFDLWWDLWTMQDKNINAGCPTDSPNILPSQDFYNTTGLFRPLDPADPTPLGFYKPWFYTRSGIPVNNTEIGFSTTFWYQYRDVGFPPNIQNNAPDWGPDPDNY